MPMNDDRMMATYVGDSLDLDILQISVSLGETNSLAPTGSYSLLS